MPYGAKEDIDGKEIDFDKIYESMIKGAVASVGGLICQRCDDIEQPGWIHERMLRHIFEDRVAIVDTSTLNANVFYELGVRHALRRSVTVLIHRRGTTWPFNIAGLNSIEYSEDPAGLAQAQKTIRTYIVNALNEPNKPDSLVYYAMPDLRVDQPPRRLTKVEVFEYPLVKNPDKRIGFVTGDREDLTVGDIWVCSENTNMQMDNFYGKSTSATIRYLGAKRDLQEVVEDTIGDALRREMGARLAVPPATVIATRAGALEQNNVKWIFHVAAVMGEPREGYRPVQRIDQCVKNALRKAKEFQGDGVTSILFPIFGTGPGGGQVEDHAAICVDAAIEHLEGPIGCPIRVAYFYVFSDRDLETCQAIARNHPGLQRP